MKMKKGIAPVIIGFILIMLIVFGVIVAFATNASRAGLTRKHLFEASLISESDKVETYARSFLRATDLSLIQSTHNVGNGEIIMPYDLNSYYSKTYNLPFWQISSDSKNDILIPPKEILYNKFRQEISWTTSCYLKNYFDAYKIFASQEGFIFSGTPIAKVDILSNDSIRVQTDDVSIHRTSVVEERKIEINKMFKPFSEILTKFGNVTDKTEELINDDEIGKCIRNEIGICSHDKTKRDETQNALNSLASSLSTNNITYIFTVLNFKVSGSGGEIEDVVVNVSIFDNITNYTVYSLNDDRAIIGYLGVEFLVLVYKTGDDAWANSQHVPASTIAHQCPSKINLISPKTTNDICQYFNVPPNTCNDPGNNIYRKETCEDFTGSYEDVCVGNTLYQYKCHTSKVCYYEEKDCTKCSDGACEFVCSGEVSVTNNKINCGDTDFTVTVTNTGSDVNVEITDELWKDTDCDGTRDTEAVASSTWNEFLTTGETVSKTWSTGAANNPSICYIHSIWFCSKPLDASNPCWVWSNKCDEEANSGNIKVSWNEKEFSCVPQPKLTVSTMLDIDWPNNPRIKTDVTVTGVDVTYGPVKKSSGINGIAEFDLPEGTYDISVNNLASICTGFTDVCLVQETESDCKACGCTWDVILGWCKGHRGCTGKSQADCNACPGCDWSSLRPFSHFWDHNCSEAHYSEGWWEDTAGSPVGTYTFTMYVGKPGREITAFYKSFTHINDSAGNLDSFDYDGSTISGYLVNELGGMAYSESWRHDGCTGTSNEYHWERNITLEYSTNGGSTWNPIDNVTISPDDASWSKAWNCVSGANKLRASYNPNADPKDWYYIGTSAEIDISCGPHYKLNVSTLLDIDWPKNPRIKTDVTVTGVDVAYGPVTKSSGDIGIAEFDLPEGTYDIRVSGSVVDPQGTRFFSHFWDHNCSESNDGWGKDTGDNPYTFTMYVGKTVREIWAFYKTFTYINNSAGTRNSFDFDGSTISGYLVNELGGMAYSESWRYDGCSASSNEIPWKRNITLEYSTNGGSTWIPIDTVTISTADASWSKAWSCVSGANKLRASYIPNSDPKDWYYMGTSAEIDISCPLSCGAYGWSKPNGATAISSASGYPPVYAIDDDLTWTRSWSSGYEYPPEAWIEFDLSDRRCISGVKVYIADIPTTVIPETIDVQVSDNPNGPWTTVASGWTINTINEWHENHFSEVVASYINLSFTDFQEHHAWLTEFKLYNATL